MHLVWLESASENAAVAALVRSLDESVNSVWIGASDAADEGEWRWVDLESGEGTLFWSGQSSQSGGSAVAGNYVNWGNLRPDHGDGDEDCVMLTLARSSLGSGTWDDDPCSRSGPFVCEAR
jgi:hypothetical protein